MRRTAERAEAGRDLKQASKIACSFCHVREFHLNYEELFVMFKTEAQQHAMINSEATQNSATRFKKYKDEDDQNPEATATENKTNRIKFLLFRMT